MPHAPPLSPPGSAFSDYRPIPHLDTYDTADIDDAALDDRDSQQRLQDRMAAEETMARRDAAAGRRAGRGGGGGVDGAGSDEFGGRFGRRLPSILRGDDDDDGSDALGRRTRRRRRGRAAAAADAAGGSQSDGQPVSASGKSMQR